jgi:hypothetical protein
VGLWFEGAFSDGSKELAHHPEIPKISSDIKWSSHHTRQLVGVSLSIGPRTKFCHSPFGTTKKPARGAPLSYILCSLRAAQASVVLYVLVIHSDSKSGTDATYCGTITVRCEPSFIKSLARFGRTASGTGPIVGIWSVHFIIPKIVSGF